MASLAYHGHSTFTLTTDDGTTIVIDPFFGDNPWFEGTVADVPKADYVFCTHGHFDHTADAVPLLKRTGATVVGAFEIVTFLQGVGIENGHPMSIGGSWQFPFGRVKMTIALHGSGVFTGEGGPPLSTMPGGFLFDLGPGKRVYHAGDTALTMDMQLLKGEVDVALLPIGDNFTMGPEDAVRAVDFIEPAVVIPIHYDTWPYVEADAEAFKAAVGDRAEVVIVAPGTGSYEF